MDHVKCCNKADLVLVPSSWHFNLYKDKGVMLRDFDLFQEAIDTEFFNPQYRQSATMHRIVS